VKETDGRNGGMNGSRNGWKNEHGPRRKGEGDKEQGRQIPREREMETRASDKRRGAMAKGTEGLLAEGAYHHGLGGWRHAYTSHTLVIAPINVVALGLCDRTTTKTLDDVLRLDAHFHDDLDMFGHVRRRHLFMYPSIHLLIKVSNHVYGGYGHIASKTAG
jgi:hypothetical protein